MNHTTYILISKIAKKTYVGHTDSLNRRLLEHNKRKGVFSRRYAPWKVLYKETFLTEVKSIKREKYFKSAAERRWMKENLFKR